MMWVYALIFYLGVATGMSLAYIIGETHHPENGIELSMVLFPYWAMPLIIADTLITSWRQWRGRRPSA